MNGLRELQQRLQARLLCAGAAGDADIVAADVDERALRLDIYSHAYRQRLRDALRNEFLGVHAMAGDLAFTAICDAYIDACPSRHPNIRWFGVHLPAWLKQTATAAIEPAWADMAALDWAISTAFDAADAETASADDLACVAAERWPSLALRLSPHLQRLSLTWNVDVLRIAADNAEPIVAAVEEAPFVLAVWRTDSGVRHRRLDVDEADAIFAVSQGASFAEVCERLCDWHAPAQVVARSVFLLRRWLAAGWIARFDIH